MSEYDSLSVKEERKKAHEVLDQVIDGKAPYNNDSAFVDGKFIFMQNLGGEE
ncbi:hypothetical protein TIN4_60 [Tsukamurella phage TIN4]|uniref:Uncharacterized protein n=2 Tax=Tinduovirus TIN3 TaxID=1982571 RepID=A0A0K0N5T9_9CAUD|nr:hypothetical protein AVT54_gp065 [Tsukamurella phage TIN3]YP_009604190.1 hypothetical protein FDH87_gp065 [Tsukamurella phage TIN4]AKJ71857.1 hypothetical protein TIN3_60 [Tsukamurella phage TIN3]AKJ71966.1 hypothetical protein TIN4_60 [Tsukamurella phage TIN4]